MDKSLVFELPLNEKVRGLLKLECLFKHLRYSMHGHSAWDSRTAITTFMEIIRITSKTTLKAELIKEIEKKTGYLSRLSNNSETNFTLLDSSLTQLHAQLEQLHAIQGQPGKSLLKHPLTSEILRRSSGAIGICDFDLPYYHFWLNQPPKRRLSDLAIWIKPFTPFENSVKLLLNIIREHTYPEHKQANNGYFQHNLDSQTPYQLIRISLPPDTPYYVELSGGKHRFSARFLSSNTEAPNPSSITIDFDLNCCAI